MPDWNPQMRELPECLVTYEIAQAGEAVRLTMTEAHQWDVPDDLLAGGRMGWPVILSSLKSLLGLCVVLVAPGEALANPTNLQWIMATALPLIAATEAPPGGIARANQIGFVALAGLS